MLRRNLLGIGLAALLAIPTASSLAQEAPKVELDGFRSAKFGMTEEEVGKIITKDFKGKNVKVSKSRNPVEKTTALSIEVDDLLKESGKARVVYIFGYETKKLIHVNVLWGRPVDEEPDPEKLATTANILRRHFAGLGFEREKVVMNVPLGGGRIIVFRGTDEKERMVALMLNVPGKKPSGEKKGAEDAKSKELAADLKQMSLQLSYIENTKKPDIFRVKKGQF